MTRRRLDRGRFIEWIEAVEGAWLGWSLPPPRRVLGGWAADRPGEYCPRCGCSVGRGELSGGGCASCRGKKLLTDRVVRLGAYQGPLREWVRTVKYRAWAEMADPLGHRLGAAVAAGLPSPVDCVVVPMPMPWQRRLYRGIDHARLIADGVGRKLRAPVLPLLAMRNGPPQVSLSAGRRPRRGARMVLSRRSARLSLEECTAVLVDDVRTTGASLDSAARLLRRLGPRRVIAAVVAVTDDPARRRTDPEAQSA